jgi:hypothetical protein
LARRCQQQRCSGRQRPADSESRRARHRPDLPCMTLAADRLEHRTRQWLGECRRIKIAFVIDQFTCRKSS